MENFSTRLAKFRQFRGLNQDATGKLLGVTGKYVGMLERGDKEVAEDSTIARLLTMLEMESPASAPDPDEHRLREAAPLMPSAKPDVSMAIAVRSIPVLSWAHAGAATAYEELPKHWQEQAWTTCRDTKAFALTVEGDSMMPHCLPGDLVVLSPSEEPRHGQLVVAKLADDGILLRRYMRAGKNIRLTAYNPVYPPEDFEPDAFHWIYPVHSLNRVNP